MGTPGRPGQKRPPRRRLAVASVAAWLAVAGLAGLAVAGLDAAARGQEDAPASTRSGERLYQQNCVGCHGTGGEGTQRGPALEGAGAASADFYLRSGRMPISDPTQEVERGEPRFTDEQIRALVDYVAGLGGGPAIPDVETDGADRSRGGELYRLNCAACHNWDAKGGALVGHENPPDLHGIDPLQVAEAVRVGPGSMPRFDEGALTDAQLDDVTAYVAYLDDPRDAGGWGLAHWGPATEGAAAAVVLGGLLAVVAWLGARRA